MTRPETRQRAIEIGSRPFAYARNLSLVRYYPPQAFRLLFHEACRLLSESLPRFPGACHNLEPLLFPSAPRPSRALLAGTVAKICLFCRVCWDDGHLGKSIRLSDRRVKRQLHVSGHTSVHYAWRACSPLAWTPQHPRTSGLSRIWRPTTWTWPLTFVLSVGALYRVRHRNSMLRLLTATDVRRRIWNAVAPRRDSCAADDGLDGPLCH